MSSFSDYSRVIAITGGAGFIGLNLLRRLVKRYPEQLFVNIDALTYAANLSSLADIEQVENYKFECVDIRNQADLRECFDRYNFDGLIHLAAESHVDRSILGPADFIETNIVGTFNLLEMARQQQDKKGRFRYHQVSTDEVFGSLGSEGFFTEESNIKPNSPYSASKASADHLVRAYHKTYSLDLVTTNCSNNYGPYQFPEKLIPLVINNARHGKELPIYGDGKQVRDWLYVDDHCAALDLVFHKGKAGETYMIGGNNEMENIELVRMICKLLDEKLGGEEHERLIQFVADRPGHDRRYAIDATKIKRELGWEPAHTFEDGISKTVQWYLDNSSWLENCMSGEYRKYYTMMYEGR